MPQNIFGLLLFFRFCVPLFSVLLSADFRTPLDFLGSPRGAFWGTSVSIFVLEVTPHELILLLLCFLR